MSLDAQSQLQGRAILDQGDEVPLGPDDMQRVLGALQTLDGTPLRQCLRVQALVVDPDRIVWFRDQW